jgi:hypothetical protein
VPSAVTGTGKNKAWRGIVDQTQAESAALADGDADGKPDLRPAGPIGNPSKKADEEQEAADSHATNTFLSPDDHDTGVTGKRVFIGGLATPFSLRKEHDTASMITLASPMDRSSVRPSTADSGSFVAAPAVEDGAEQQGTSVSDGLDKDGSHDQDGAGAGAAPGVETPFVTPFLGPASPASPGERPGLERFVTADEALN